MKIISAVVLGILSTYGGVIVLTVLMLSLLFVEAMQMLSSNLYDRSISTSLPIQVNGMNSLGKSLLLQHRLSRLKIKARLKFTRAAKESNENSSMIMGQRFVKVSSRLSFDRCFYMFHIIKMMMRIGNKIVSNFLIILVSMGIGAASTSGYIAIKFYNKLPLIMYMGCAIILPLCLFVNFFLIYLAATPNRNVKRFKQFWKQFESQGLIRLQLKSCPDVGYAIGPISNVTNRSALTIADVILNCTATAVLMKFVS